MKKTVEILKLDSKGRGIGRVDNKTIFIFNALPDEIVEVANVKERSKYITATSINILKKSSKRINTICPWFGICGGCDIMHMSYLDQLKYKEDKVKNTILNVLKDDIKINSIVFDSNLNYRNKAIFKVDKKIGFYGKETHEIVGISSCFLVDEKINKILSIISSSISLEGIKEIMIRVSKNTDESLILFTLSKKINEEKIISVLKNEVNSIVTYLDEYKVLFGNGFIYEKIGAYVFKISPESFFQVNTNGAYKLYSVVKHYIDKNDSVLDLYCGIGSIGIFISDKSRKVLGVELNKYAVEDALENKKINDLKEVNFMCLNTSDFNRSLRDIDVVIVDPPRSGLDKKTISYLLKEKAKKIIYVSCDLMTLTRDLGYLKEFYDIKEITPVDMFPNTYHVETVALLSRQINVHKMKLNSTHFEMIKSGEKMIELRLYDEKRQQVKVGDNIIFTNTSTGETLNTTVTKLHRFDSFKELYKSLPLLKCGYTIENVDNAKPSDMEQYYSVEEQNKYGVVGIEICRPKKITDEVVSYMSLK